MMLIVAEDRLLSAIITEVKVLDIQFKLLPTYLVYMASRYALVGRFRSGVNSNNRTSHLTALTTKVVREIYRQIEVRNEGTVGIEIIQKENVFDLECL